MSPSNFCKIFLLIVLGLSFLSLKRVLTLTNLGNKLRFFNNASALV